MSEKNLLIVVMDTNPVWWGLQSSGLIKSQGSQKSNGVKGSENYNFSDYLSAVIGFLNVYKTMNQLNAVSLIAAHNTKADFLYPSESKVVEKYSSPWEKYENISDMDYQIKENIKIIMKTQATALENDEINAAPNDSLITSALGLALCYVNRIHKKYALADSVSYRILVIKASEDSSNQYMNFMNNVFSAEKLNVMIDSCILMEDSSLLQQASNLTNGFYFKIPQISGLLNYLIWLFLPNESTRKIIVYPPKSEVDYRAACFCHRKLIDIGYVCSVCLSVFCSFTPICSTCDCNFVFDVNMLKKASSMKQFNFHNIQKPLQKIPSQTQIGTGKEDFTGNLTTQFQDTSISSPITMIQSSKPEQLIQPVQQPIMTTKIITTSASLRTAPRQYNTNDSLDMLE